MNTIKDFEFTIIDDEAEMEAIISLAVDAFFELEDEGGFVAQSPEDVMELIMSETDSVYRFIKMACETDPSYSDLQDDVYNAYVEFAIADGALAVFKKAGFTSDLYAKGFGWGRSSLRVEGKRPYTYTGLKLKDDFDLKDRAVTRPSSLFGRLDDFPGTPKTEPPAPEDIEPDTPSLLAEAARESLAEELGDDFDIDENWNPGHTEVNFDDDDE